MRSVHGSSKGWDNLHGKKRKPKPKPTYKKHKCYKERGENLQSIGYSAYVLYLKSKEWQDIRSRQLEAHPSCLLCLSDANQVHHLSYDVLTLMGGNPHCLVSLCRPCHESIEIEKDGNKRTLDGANWDLFVRAAAVRGSPRKWAIHTLKQECFRMIAKRLRKSGLLPWHIPKKKGKRKG